MSFFEYPDSVTKKPVQLHYQATGEGLPLLLIAPGGMKSAIPMWKHSPYNPYEAWADLGFRIIAMDQRNAGESTGPVHASHGWHTFAEDQLALLDHLGADKFVVAGMCIGGSYCMQLVLREPARVAGAILFQTIGLDNNRDAFYQMYDGWAASLAPGRVEVRPEDWAGLRENMYGNDKYLFTCDGKDLAECKTPIQVLLGNDLYHPESASRRVAADVVGAELIERWKAGDDIETGLAATRDFLKRIRVRTAK